MIVVGTIDAIKPITSTGSFMVNPLPLAGNELTIHFKQPMDQKMVDVNVYDVTGTLRYTGHQLANDEMKLDLSNLPKGMYLLRVNANGNESSVKILRD